MTGEPEIRAGSTAKRCVESLKAHQIKKHHHKRMVFFYFSQDQVDSNPGECASRKGNACVSGRVREAD